MKKVIVFGVLMICICVFFVPIIQVFSFEETRTEKPIKYYLKIGSDKDFKIIFTHSIHLTDVVESYRVLDSHDIQLVSMQYSDVAIGMPSYAEEGQTLIYKDGLYNLMYNDKKLQEFSLYIGAIDYELQFQYEAQSYDLKKQLHKGRSYRFSVERISIFEYMMKGERIRE